jgi:hypothetical protein
MPEHVTLLRPDAAAPDSRRTPAELPSEFLDQVRGRVRLLALFLLIGFSVDLLFFAGAWVGAMVGGRAFLQSYRDSAFFQWINLGAVLLSASMAWLARKGALPAKRLHDLALAYVVVICFVIAFETDWQHFLDRGTLPNLTWVPGVVILLPLIVPGPPRRMLAAAAIAAAMSPLALVLLAAMGKVTADADNYLAASVSPLLAVGFSYMGARVIYGLGREVAAAREWGSYRLEELLGRGGMGEVWRARHRMLARPAAIKLIRPAAGATVASDEAVRRFEREAQVIARLNSPHTVHLFDFGVANGSFYYAMELLEGFDADALVRRFGALPYERAIYLLRQICHSLSEADSCGVVHRDIKPANIFLCRYGEDRDFVKVLDFGLVRALDDGTNTAAALTQENMIHGTPAFMAPEQALGRAAIDGRADIYATGCVAYWFLTGQLVFPAETPMAMLVHHAHTEPPPPSSRSEQAIPPDLDRLILACLAKDPASRPQSARELSQRLSEIEGAERWTEARARAWWESYRPTGG